MRRSSWSPRRCSSSSLRACHPRRSPSSRRPSSRCAVALEAAFAGLGVPAAIEAPARLGHTTLGRALLDLLRFAWAGADRKALYGFLRSPFSGLTRSDVDFVEGRLRGRAVTDPERVVEVSVSLRGGRPLPLLDDLREADDPVAACRAAAASLVRNAYGTDEPSPSDEAATDLRALDAVLGVLDELDRVRALGVACRRDDVVAALERATARGARAGRARPRGGARPHAGAHAALRHRLPASGSSRARCRDARRRRRSSTTTRDVTPTTGSAPVSPARSRRRATATCSPRPARDRRGGSSSSARRRRTRGAHASRARSGRRCRCCTTPMTCAARRFGGRSRA